MILHLRYIHICHSRSYKKVFSTKLTLLYCLITWVVGVLIDLPNFTGTYLTII